MPSGFLILAIIHASFLTWLGYVWLPIGWEIALGIYLILFSTVGFVTVLEKLLVRKLPEYPEK